MRPAVRCLVISGPGPVKETPVRLPDLTLDTFEQLVRAGEAQGIKRDYLQARRDQLAVVVAQAGEALGAVILEIGGGFSGQSAMLADLAERVVCTDLLDVTGSHAGKLTAASRLGAAGGRKVHYVCARAEALAVADGSVDTVFSSHVLEHVGDRALVAREIWRVLRPGGHAVMVVPNRMEQVHRALGHYAVTVPRQIAKAALSWSGVGRLLGIVPAVPAPGKPRGRREWAGWLGSLLLYAPHGTYRSHLEEFRSSGIREWDDLFERAGFRITHRFTTALEGNVAFFNERLASRVRSGLLPILSRAGHLPPFVLLGHSYALVALKAVAPHDEW